MKRLTFSRDTIRADTAVSLLNGLAFLCVTGVILLLLTWSLNQFVLKEASKKAEILLHHNLAIHTYFNQALKPAVFDLQTGVEDSAYFDPVWMSSTYAVREIDRIFQKSNNFSGYYYKEAAINARSPQNEADDYERAALLEMAQNPGQASRSAIRFLDGRPYYTVMLRGEVMETACLRCHSEPEKAPGGLTAKYGTVRSFNRQAGELASVISVRIPLASALADGVKQLIYWSAALVLALIILLFWLQTNQRWLLRAPLEVIRNTALEISSNSAALGRQIPLPFGKEMVELATAFNRMSSGLRQHRDDLERLVAERTRELEENQHLIDGILEATPNYIFLIDRSTEYIVYRNQEFNRFFGVSAQTAMQVRDIAAIVFPDDREIFAAHCHDLSGLSEPHSLQVVFRVTTPRGGLRWLKLRSVVYSRDETHQPLQILNVGEDVTEHQEAVMQLEFMSTHDFLTGLSNRAHFEANAEKIWQDGKSSASILILDVDDLKRVNDLQGHAQGDWLLRQAAEALRAIARQEDIASRIGGDEFALLLVGSSESEAIQIKERIQQAFAERTQSLGINSLGLSIGICAVEPRTSLSDSIRKADERMYREKNRRKRRKSP